MATSTTRPRTPTSRSRSNPSNRDTGRTNRRPHLAAAAVHRRAIAPVDDGTSEPDRRVRRHLPRRHRIEVIDLTAHPPHARADNITAVPTLIRRQPISRRELIGDLTNTDRLATFLQLPAA